MTETYMQTETVPIKATISDKNGALVDPLTVTIIIKNPSGTRAVDDLSMMQESTGVYYYDYPLAPDAPSGAWKYYVTASSGNLVIEDDAFLVTSI